VLGACVCADQVDQARQLSARRSADTADQARSANGAQIARRGRFGPLYAPFVNYVSFFFSYLSIFCGNAVDFSSTTPSMRDVRRQSRRHEQTGNREGRQVNEQQKARIVELARQCEAGRADQFDTSRAAVVRALGLKAAERASAEAFHIARSNHA
jgi:hypothetical protein